MKKFNIENEYSYYYDFITSELQSYSLRRYTFFIYLRVELYFYMLQSQKHFHKIIFAKSQGY